MGFLLFLGTLIRIAIIVLVIVFLIKGIKYLNKKDKED